MQPKNRKSLVGTTFNPVGTDSTGIITRETDEGVEFYYAHAPKVLHFVDRQTFAKMMHPAGKKRNA